MKLAVRYYVIVALAALPTTAFGVDSEDKSPSVTSNPEIRVRGRDFRVVVADFELRGRADQIELGPAGNDGGSDRLCLSGKVEIELGSSPAVVRDKRDLPRLPNLPAGIQTRAPKGVEMIVGDNAKYDFRSGMLSVSSDDGKDVAVVRDYGITATFQEGVVVNMRKGMIYRVEGRASMDAASATSPKKEEVAETGHEPDSEKEEVAQTGYEPATTESEQAGSQLRIRLRNVEKQLDALRTEVRQLAEALE